jgi:hypothetical protein
MKKKIIINIPSVSGATKVENQNQSNKHKRHIFCIQVTELSIALY